MNRRTSRRLFIAGLKTELGVVWPILSGLVFLITALGIVVGWIEAWPVADSIYFAFVSALTIGYGDLSPTVLTSRVLAMVIGVCGVLSTALLAAIAVRALGVVTDQARR